MSNVAIPEADGDHRLELITYTRNKDDQAVDLLEGLAVYPFKHRVGWELEAQLREHQIEALCPTRC